MRITWASESFLRRSSHPVRNVSAKTLAWPVRYRLVKVQGQRSRFFAVTIIRAFWNINITTHLSRNFHNLATFEISWLDICRYKFRCIILCGHNLDLVERPRMHPSDHYWRTPILASTQGYIADFDHFQKVLCLSRIWARWPIGDGSGEEKMLSSCPPGQCRCDAQRILKIGLHL